MASSREIKGINVRWSLKFAHTLPSIPHKSNYVKHRLLHHVVIDWGEGNLKDQCKILKEYPDEFQGNSHGR